MRELLARSLATLTALVVVGLAAAFSLVQNMPDRRVPVAAGQLPSPGVNGAIAAGRTVYERNGCAGCHSIGGAGNPRNPLDGAGARLGREAIRDSIVAAGPVGARFAPGVARIKQSYAALPEDELRQLVDFLASLKGGNGERAP